MTPRMLAFCEEYLVDNNGEQACIRAGYTPKTARKRATTLLAHPEVQARIALKRAERSSRPTTS